MHLIVYSIVAAVMTWLGSDVLGKYVDYSKWQRVPHCLLVYVAFIFGIVIAASNLGIYSVIACGIVSFIFGMSWRQAT